MGTFQERKYWIEIRALLKLCNMCQETKVIYLKKFHSFYWNVVYKERNCPKAMEEPKEMCFFYIEIMWQKSFPRKEYVITKVFGDFVPISPWFFPRVFSALLIKDSKLYLKNGTLHYLRKYYEIMTTGFEFSVLKSNKRNDNWKTFCWAHRSENYSFDIFLHHKTIMEIFGTVSSWNCISFWEMIHIHYNWSENKC